MANSEDVIYITSALLCNSKGYVTEEELSNEYTNWRDILDVVEETLFSIGITIKSFDFDGNRCYAAIGIPSDFDIFLTESESFLLIDFIMRYEMFGSDKKGIDKRKWKEIIISKHSGRRMKFNEPFSRLKDKGLLFERSGHVMPGWRYYAVFDLQNLLEEIQKDAKLSLLIKEEREREGERGILD